MSQRTPAGSGEPFPEAALPVPVSVQDLSDRVNLLTGYLLGALRLLTRKQDRNAAAALRWTVPYLRALLVLAARHEAEFAALTAPCVAAWERTESDSQ
jgi:hypothetical protein